MPDDFRREPNMRWIPARNLDEAVRLSRAIDQHLQAVEVNRLLRRGRYSMTDLARSLAVEALLGHLDSRLIFSAYEFLGELVVIHQDGHHQSSVQCAYVVDQRAHLGRSRVALDL